MTDKKSAFQPDWFEDTAPPDSFRSILKWGGPAEFKHPNKRLYALMKKTFGMTDADFQRREKMGLEQVPQEIPSHMKKEHLDALTAIVGSDNVRTDAYSRLQVAYGKTMVDLMRLREGIVENVPDVVLHPRSTADIESIIRYCDDQRIAVYVYGGGSSVTRGVEAVRGGVTLDMRVHMNKVVRFSEKNHTITVQAGMSGPDLEKALNEAPERFHATRKYTCGHFPQSFEYSAVGGWVVTRGAGQNSTYYGKIEDLVVCQEYVTPAGTLRTGEYPATATGPSIDQIMMGSEGAFGVLTEVTLRVFHLMPENQRRFSYVFRTWEEGREAAREIMQGQFGFPSVFRLSDPEETDVALKLYGVEGTVIDRILSARGYRPMERCLMLGFTDGEAAFTRSVARNIGGICRHHGAMYTTGYVTRGWEKGRFLDPYMREDLQDYGIMTDTLECAVNWENLEGVYESVRAFCHSRPKTICTTHMSHFYPQGCNLYFIFIARIDEIPEYVAYQAGILDAIQKSGAAMSHHHGIGKMTAPWLEAQIGTPAMDVYRALKRHFDPHGIMNPGGTLGLDLSPEQRRDVTRD
jgi:alkyldihydroxyacetonephosphate synthase